jgi:two-component system, NarL family, nitrate/nitrite response regulator NarL
MNVSVVIRSAILREGLNKFLMDAGFCVHSETPALEEALIVEAIRDRRAELIVLDGSLCESPSDLVASLWQAVPGARIVIMAANGSASRIPDECLAAVDGVLSPEISSDAMMQALRLIRLGARVVLPDLLSGMTGSVVRPRIDTARQPGTKDAATHDQLPSPRETEILHYLIEGCSNKTIARQLGITEATVKVHVKGLLRKIRAANRTQAAIWALNNGIGPARPAPMPGMLKPTLPAQQPSGRV